MLLGRKKMKRRSAGFAAMTGMICLVLVVGAPALALDPGDGSVVDTRQLNTSKPDHARLPSKQDPKDPPPGEKAALSVYQVYSMFFGTLVDNDGYVVLGTGDSIVQDPDHLVYGGVPQSAQIRLNGDPFVAVSLDITPGVATGFSLGSFETDYGTPPLSGLTLDSGGYLTLHVGARLQLDAATLSTGSGQQIGYTVSAVYE